MKQLQKLYQKYNNCITKWIFPLILLWYPLIKINQGVDVSDSTYSLGNYLFFPEMKGMWVVSTYLSNVIGWLMVKLPFADRLLVMNLYTGLLISALVLFMYFFMRKWMPEWIIFIGEIIAIGFLWIPTGILYNYLTYGFLAVGALLLYKGLVEEKDRLLIAAGVILGLNVWIRVSNLTEMALVVCVWYHCYIRRERIQNFWQTLLRKTGRCIAGYAVGAIVPLIAILLQYGLSGIMDMVAGLTQVQNVDDSYTIFSMIGAAIDAYVRTGKWAAFIVAGMVLGLAMFMVKKESFIPVKKAAYIAGILVLIRFFWGRGMFSFRYYEDYSSMYEWGMIGLYLALAACIYLFVAKGVSSSEKLWGMLSLVILCITPLGSNNYTYQNLNNLFLTAPITVYAFVKWFRRRYPAEKKVLLFPSKAMVSALALMILIQSVGFHLVFVFRDGMDGTKRNTTIMEPKAVAGMKTTKINAKALSGLLVYMEKEHDADNSETEIRAVYFGDCPGLAYLLRKPAAIDTTWPDLASYSLTQFEDSLASLEDRPVIIIRNVESDSEVWIAKKEVLQDYMSAKHYESAYENEGYTVYQPQEK